jgi:TRAP-type C4-dicarboxylate transport system permease small subunit
MAKVRFHERCWFVRQGKAMNTIYTLIDKAMQKVCGLSGLLACLVIVFMTGAVAAEVVLRQAGLPAFGWTLELSEYGLVLVSFLGAPWVLRHQEHISVDIVIRHVRPTMSRILLTIADVTSAAACLILAWFATQVALEALQRGTILYNYFAIPQWLILAILPLGAILLTIEFALRIWRRLGDVGADASNEAAQ